MLVLMRKLAAVAVAVVLLLSMQRMAEASVLDRVFFRVLGLVVVWGADSGAAAAPVASDFVIMTAGSGSPGADLIPGFDVRPVLTGTLSPISLAAPADGTIFTATGSAFTDNGTAGVLDAADRYTPFNVTAAADVDLSAVADVDHSFYVASNTAFDVYAQTTGFTTGGSLAGVTAANVNWSMALTVAGTDGGLAFGGAAQDPTGAGTGIAAATNLGAFGAATPVFDGGQRTASAVGTLAQQSVRFDTSYNMAAGAYDLSQGEGLVQADVTYTIYVP